MDLRVEQRMVVHTAVWRYPLGQMAMEEPFPVPFLLVVANNCYRRYALCALNVFFVYEVFAFRS